MLARETPPFKPLYIRDKSVNGIVSNGLVKSLDIAASTTASVATSLPGASANNTECQIQIANRQGTGWAWVQFGVSNDCPLAVAGQCYPVAPNGVVVVTVDSEVNSVSVVLDTSATGNVNFCRGEGT